MRAMKIVGYLKKNFFLDQNTQQATMRSDAALPEAFIVSNLGLLFVVCVCVRLFVCRLPHC